MGWYNTKKAQKLINMNMSDVVVFDTETTGLTPVKDEIIQITLCDGNGSVLFSSYICPTHRKRWPSASKINGIKPSMVKDAPKISEVRGEIQDIFNKAKLVVGYNINFDIKFVEAVGITVPINRFDVMNEFKAYTHHLLSHYKLVSCADYFGHSFYAHDASEDAKVTAACFYDLIHAKDFPAPTKEEKRVYKENPQLKPKREKRKIKFSIQHRTKRFSNLWYGLILAIGAAAYYLYSNGMLNKSTAPNKELLYKLYETTPESCEEIIATVIFVIAVLMILLFVIRIVRGIIMRIFNLIRKTIKAIIDKLK